MSTDDEVLIGVVIIAFIAGYAIVSYIVKTIKAEKPPTYPPTDPSQRK